MKEHIEAYKSKLEHSIIDFMRQPATPRSAEAILGMMKCWLDIDALAEAGRECETLTREKAVEWVHRMQNEDGTVGAHWAVESTNAYRPESISEWCWYAAMNMVYSDYCAVANKYGVGVPEFYADLAKAFLFDEDAGAPSEKLAAYHCHIVK